MADDRPAPPLPPGIDPSEREDAPPSPRQIPGSGTPVLPPTGNPASPIPNARAAEASYRVPSGSPLDQYLAHLGPAPVAPPTADAMIRHYLDQAGGDPSQAVVNIQQARAADPQNLELRNAEHALFSAHMMKTLGPILGPATVATSVPAYSAAKAVGQPFGAFKGATPPSMRELQYGLWPLLRQLGLMR